MSDRKTVFDFFLVWQVWENWGECSITCSEEDNIGVRSRGRGCDGDLVQDCSLLGGGESVEFDACNTEPCPSN